MTQESTFHTLFWILFGGVLLMRFFFIFRMRRSGDHVLPNQQAIEHEGRALFYFRLASWFLMIGMLVSYALTLPWLEALHIPFPDWLRWAGFVVGLISVLFWTWTQITLGKEWSPQLRLREGQHLITSGPYAWIRHPMYSAMFGFGLGLVLVSANWVFLALALLVIVGLAIRIPQEEKMLVGQFGEEYQAYMRKTGRLLPKW